MQVEEILLHTRSDKLSIPYSVQLMSESTSDAIDGKTSLDAKTRGFFWQLVGEGEINRSMKWTRTMIVSHGGMMFPKQSPDNWVIEGFVGVVGVVMHAPVN